jgi:hypothetical protein
MINDGGITLNRAIYSQVAPISCVCDFVCFQSTDSHLDCVYSGRAVLQIGHASFGSPTIVSAINKSLRNSLCTGFQVDGLILETVKASTSMDKDSCDVTAFAFVCHPWCRGFEGAVRG